MPQGDKSKYTGKQKRQALHIEKSLEAKGTSPDEDAAIAWATVNKQDGGGKLSGSGRAKSGSRTAAQRSASAKKGAATRKRNAAG